MYRRTVLFALVALAALAQTLFSQDAPSPAQGRGGRGRGAQASPPPSNLPFDPHDISGIWRNPGGFDPIIGNNRPPMTDYGKEMWSKTRSSARNTPLSYGFYQDQKDWNDPLFLCDPSGFPRTLDYSNYRFVKLDNEFVEFFERDRVWRDLWTDGRKLPTGADAKPRWYGYATAHWEGDTLVVESSGYDVRSWIDPYGSIHSDQMHIEERYRRIDHDSLEFTMTLTDPKVYIGAWTGKKVLRLLNSSQQVQKGLWGKRPDGTAYGDLREEYCVYSIEQKFWQGRPLDGVGGTGTEDKK